MQHFGIDISSNNHGGGRSINWSAVAADLRARGNGGQPFAIIKATQGAWYVNEWFAADVAGAIAAGVAVAAYLMDEGPANVALEESFFRRVAGPIPQFNDLELPEGVGAYAQHCAGLVAQNPAAADYINQDEENRGFPPGAGIWEANYNNTPGVTHRAALLHQYWDKGSVAGIEGWVDLDVFLGTEQQFASMFSNVAQPAPPPPAPKPIPPPPPVVLPPPTRQKVPGKNMTVLTQSIATDAFGNGWTDFALNGSMVVGPPDILDAAPGTPAPQADGERFDRAAAHRTIGAAAGFQRVEVVDGAPNAVYGVSIEVEP